MFRLTIDLPSAPAIGTHGSREAAHAALRRYLTATGQPHRLTESTWTHTSYDITGGPIVLGRAVIDEICGCDHPHREHDDVGCTVTILAHGRLEDCPCRCYLPVCDDPTLFDAEPVASAVAPAST